MFTKSLVIAVLLAGLLLSVVPGASAIGHSKVAVAGLLPGEMVSAFHSDDADAIFDDEGRPEGELLNSVLASDEGKSVEIFLPVGFVSKLFIWSEAEGYTPLARIRPTSADEFTMIAAPRAVMGMGGKPLAAAMADDSWEDHNSWDDPMFAALFDNVSDAGANAPLITFAEGEESSEGKDQ